MKSYLKRIFPFILSLIIFGLVVYYVEPPKDWPSASVFQILTFFLPLLACATFLVNIYFQFLAKSLAIGLGIMVLVVLKSIDQFNIVTASLTLITSLLLATAFKKPKEETQIILRKRNPKFRGIKRGLS